MTAYENMKATMDAQVDKHLGDSIQYRRDGELIVHEGSDVLPAFIQNLSDEGGFDTLTPVMNRWRLKIRKSLLPSAPKQSDKITSAKLAGTYRPGADVPTDNGDYWLVDLQKAPA